MTAGRLTQSWHLVAYTDAEELGGAERVLATTLAGLPPHVRVTVGGVDAHVISTIARESGAARALLPRAAGKGDVRRGAVLREAIRQLAPDVLHVHLRHPYACQWAVVAGVRLPRVATVAAEQLIVPPANGLQALTKRALSKQLSAHVAVGERSARELERLVRLPAASVRTIWNGVPDPGPQPPRPQRVNPELAFVGRLTEQKGLDVLLDALARVPGASLVVVGDGPERGPAEALAHALGVADRVRFAGWSDDVAGTLAAADVFVLPSRNEALPLAVIEAMLAALPIVASDVGSVAELLADDTGVLVQPDDPAGLARELRALVSSHASRVELGARARARALRHFTAERMVADWLELYEGLVLR